VSGRREYGETTGRSLVNIRAWEDPDAPGWVMGKDFDVLVSMARTPTHGAASANEEGKGDASAGKGLVGWLALCVDRDWVGCS